MIDKIILLGYMGSGKTTIAKLLAPKTGFPLLDLDQIIENETNSSIDKLFSEKGEIFFRKFESQTFRRIMNEPGKAILSLGGGTPCYANNHELLNGPEVVSIYLKASVTELQKRLTLKKAQRPLLNNTSEEEMTDFIAKHLFERSYFYNKAKYVVAVDGKDPEMIVSEIENLLI